MKIEVNQVSIHPKKKVASMGEHHHTNCTNPECGIESERLKVGSRCPHCQKGKRQRDLKVPSLLVKRFDTREIVSIIPVSNPYSTQRGTDRYEVVMRGMLRQMDTDRFFIDDSESAVTTERSETNQSEE